jgi:hypothetical protein
MLYPFGMAMPGRTYSSQSGYRYGFNGQEKSDEIAAGLTTAMYWEYDSRTGRRWNVDPVVKVWESSYSTFESNPISNNDIEGDCAQRYSAKANRLGNIELIKVITQKDLDDAAMKKRIEDQQILAVDYYGKTFAGTMSQYKSTIKHQQIEYALSLGDALKGGVFSSAGEIFGGDEWAFRLSGLDMLVNATSGIPSKNKPITSNKDKITSKPKVSTTIVKNNSSTAKKVAPAKGTAVLGVNLGIVVTTNINVQNYGASSNFKGTMGVYVHNFQSGKVYVGQEAVATRPKTSLNELLDVNKKGTAVGDTYLNTTFHALPKNQQNQSALDALEAKIIKDNGGQNNPSKNYNLKAAPRQKKP